MSESGDKQTTRDRWVFGWIGLVSVAALGFLVWLIYIREEPEAHSDAFAFLPAVNATLNGLAACCLAAGYVFIRKGRPKVHMGFMVSAFALSALFLITYVIYHGVAGDTKFTGEGAIRLVYFFILITHIVLSGIMLPLILATFYFAATKRFTIHRKVAKATWPIWMYVSVTGVAIFAFLRFNS
jgi:putative membrane protein